MSIKKQIGKQAYTFLIEGENLHELVINSQKLSFPDVHKCGMCESEDLFLNARVAKNKFKYTEIKCKSCKAQLVFGQTQEDPNTFYLRRKEDKSFDWQKYDANLSE